MIHTDREQTISEKICCFTGHRDIEKRHAFGLHSRLMKLLRDKYRQGYRIFRAGGALGFDTLAALCVLDLKKEYPDAVLDLILPCRDQTARWKPHDVEIYESILQRADSVTYAEERYTGSCMFKRNRMLVDGSHCCIAYYSGSGRGGTHYTWNYAQSKGVETVNVWESGLFEKLFK